MANWIQNAVQGMKERGTLGAFGKATPSKISSAKKQGGLQEKRAIFAQNMAKIAHSHHHVHSNGTGHDHSHSEGHH